MGLVSASAASWAASITSITAQSTPAGTELTLSFDGPFTGPQLFALDGPRRIVVDFAETRAAPGLASASSALVSATRTGVPAPRAIRLVIDLAQAADLVDTRTYAPTYGSSGSGSTDMHRFVIQLAPTTDAGFARLRARGKISLPGSQLAIALPDAPKPDLPRPVPVPAPVPAVVPPELKPESRPELRPELKPELAPAQPEPPLPGVAAPGAQLGTPQPIATPLPRLPVANQIRGRMPVITIDPGHGGHDPGAPSALRGRHEKEMALAVGLALKGELERTGRFKVLITRTTDVFVPFRERTALAQRAKADLFISIHGDSIVDPSVRGGTIYTLSDGRADKEAERLAAAENKADFIGGGINMGGERDEVVDILFSLVQRETRNYAAEFAEFVARDMSRVVMMRPVYRRAASLIVLTSPDVPSVLIETGYMTSKPDAEFLFSADGQAQLARAIRKAIEQYFDRRVAPR